MKRTPTILIGAAIIGLALAGCTSATGNDQAEVNQQLQAYQKSQPVPFNNWSQYRQTVIDVEQAQIHGVATTTFFYNMGSNVPVKSCPSIGFPVASTAQLTNPTQATGSAAVIDQSEPTGIYTGGSSGTYVVCVNANGDKAIDYWEGFVETEGGPAHYDKASGQIVVDGASTVVTKTK